MKDQPKRKRVRKAEDDHQWDVPPPPSVERELNEKWNDDLRKFVEVVVRSVKEHPDDAE